MSTATANRLMSAYHEAGHVTVAFCLARKNVVTGAYLVDGSSDGESRHSHDPPGAAQNAGENQDNPVAGRGSH